MQNRRLYIIIGVAVTCGIIVLASVFLIFMRPQPQPVKEWCYVDNMTSDRDYESPIFTMSNQWRVKWNYTKSTADPKLVWSHFAVFVYGKFALGWQLIAGETDQTTNATNGIFNVNYTGSFYIEVMTNLDWKLIIEEFK